jgi:1,4-alpha-glucan branching enzyme
MRRRCISACIVLFVISSAVFSCGQRVPAVGVDGAPATGPKSVPGGILFTFYAPKAHKVAITGDFNNWSTTADPMYDREQEGLWSITLPLKAGHYEYKFLVNGEKWIPDTGNPRRTKDGFGAFNSVIEVKP